MAIKKLQWYRQCTYETEAEDGVLRDVSWIPEDLAVVGKKIVFRDRAGVWMVVSVGTRRDSSYLKEHERDHDKQRQASDI